MVDGSVIVSRIHLSQEQEHKQYEVENEEYDIFSGVTNNLLHRNAISSTNK